MALGVGWFLPSVSFGPRVSEVIGRIHQIVGPSAEAFPLAIHALEKDKAQVLYYGVLRGHLPIHADTSNGHQRHQGMWTFVLEAENRPVLLSYPADTLAAQKILLGEGQKVGQPFVAVELKAGSAFFMDPRQHFHGVTQYPTGALAPTLPLMTFIQLPHPDGREISFALREALRWMKQDERMAEFLP